ncbi:IS66 family insertion sequence element accessory protein TnpA [Sphingobacterium lumbrici]|uniref:IS66 family insertion sequence element accessory protein TnpA n=1 Tax=Sphingobacterium lumbrici TaxID=2559600 RepID=UPI0011269781|nr:IS66 family insertion sequence element accessory protein TnpB [Sphingobacterium lumbrici]
MLSLVAQWRQSGQTQKEFCSFHGIKVCTLGYWIKRSSEQEDQGRFTEIRPSMDQKRKIEVIYPNGVRVSTDGDLSLITKLIHIY